MGKATMGFTSAEQTLESIRDGFWLGRANATGKLAESGDVNFTSFHE
jgi:hypothetical protein